MTFILLSPFDKDNKRVNAKYLGPVFISHKVRVGKFGIGGTVAVFRDQADIQQPDKKIIGREVRNYYTIAAEADIRYVNTTRLKLYSGLGAGYTFGQTKFSAKDPAYTNKTYTNNAFAFQITGIGVRYGQRLGVFAEAGFGYKGILSAGFFARF